MDQNGALRDHEHTYAIYHRDGKELLLNHRNAPHQMNNLSGERSYETILRHCRTISENWRKEQNDDFEACNWYESRWTVDRNITNTAKGVRQDLNSLRQLTATWFPNGLATKQSANLSKTLYSRRSLLSLQARCNLPTLEFP